MTGSHTAPFIDALILRGLDNNVSSLLLCIQCVTDLIRLSPLSAERAATSDYAITTASTISRSGVLPVLYIYRTACRSAQPLQPLRATTPCSKALRHSLATATATGSFGQNGKRKFQQTCLTLGHPHFSDQRDRRVQAIVRSAETAHGRYNIYDPPRELLTWTPSPTEQWKQYLTVAHVPVRFWVVGEVCPNAAQLTGPGGQAVATASISVRPIRVGEGQKWTEFIKRLGDINGTSSTAQLTSVIHATASQRVV